MAASFALCRCPHTPRPYYSGSILGPLGFGNSRIEAQTEAEAEDAPRNLGCGRGAEEDEPGGVLAMLLAQQLTRGTQRAQDSSIKEYALNHIEALVPWMSSCSTDRDRYESVFPDSPSSPGETPPTVKRLTSMQKTLETQTV